MLVGSGVVDGLHLVITQQPQQQGLVQHRAQAGHQFGAAGQGQQLLVNGVQAELGMVEQHQPPRVLRQDLPAKLTADRATRTGDHHHLAGNVAGKQIGPGRHRVAAQQIGHVQIADVGHAGMAVHQLNQAGQNLHRQPRAFQVFDQPALLRRAGRRDGYHDLVYIVTVNRFFQCMG